MATPNVNPSPRQQLLADKAMLKSFMEVIARNDVRNLLEMARAQMQWNLCSFPGGVDHPERAFYMLAGAHEFLNIFYQIGIEQPSVKAGPSGQLNWKA